MSTPSLALAYIANNQNQGEVPCNAAFLGLDLATNAEASWPTGGSDVTLTQAQLASAMVHVLSGALTGDKHLILPASVPRTFIVVNETTGGHNIIVEVTGAPGSTVSLLASAGYALVYSDGTNVVEISGGGGGGGGSVTSVGLSMPPGWSVGGSPVTSSGTLAATLNAPLAKSVSYALADADNTVLFTTGSSALTATLPTAVGIAAKRSTIKKVDSGSGAVTIATTSSQTIDGQSSWSLPNQFQYLTVESDGSNCWVVANN